MTVMMQRSFASGEISPALQARTDLVKYATGLRAARNGFIPKTGGFTNRPGTTFVTEITESVSRKIAWESNTGADRYVLILTDSLIRFIYNGALLRLSAVPPAWNIATPYVIGDLVLSGGINYYCKAANTGNIPPNATYWHPLDSDIYSIPSPIIAAKIPVFQYVHEESKMAVVFDGYFPFDIIRSGHTNWKIETWTFAPSVPQVTGLTQSGAVGAVAGWVVSAISTEDEEGYPSTEVTSGTMPSGGTPVTLNWTAIPGVRGYKVYRNVNGIHYFEAFTAGNSFVDDGSILITPDNDTPFEARAEMVINGNSVIGSFQQRLLLGRQSTDIRRWFGSRIGFRRNFSKRFPQSDDDSLAVTMRGRSLNGVKHFVDLGALIVFSDSGEWIMRGSDAGILAPTSAFPEQYSYNGASDLAPLVLNTDALYVQAQGSIVRSLGFDSAGGGRGGFRDQDMTVFASHLLKNKTIAAWAYQKTPHSIVWMVRNDGALLGMTYNREHQILAWHRHDTKGTFEDVCSIPEDGEHVIYATVRRDINGSSVRYIERMSTRDFSDIRDAIFMDSALSYDGRNTTATTMTLSGGTTWEYDETLTLTASAGFFTVGDVGNKIYLTGPDGDVIRFLIEGYTSPTVVTGKPHATVPVSMRGVATSTWSRAVDQVSGLSHLEGEKVSVFGDGQVVASPNNAAYPEITVAGGAITLPWHFAVIHVGLPYITDLETLDIDSSQGESIIDKQKLVSRVSMHVEDTRGLFVGGRVPEDDTVDPLDGLFEAKIIEEQNDEPTAMKTGVVEVDIESHWNSNGRVLVRQVDPLPMSILSIAPTGKFPFRG